MNDVLCLERLIILSRINFLLLDSLCYSFNNHANSYARGEGTIVLVLKRLLDAINNGDTIRAFIRATGTNQDGHTTGLDQPSASARKALIRSIYQKASLEFDITRYMEAQ